MPLRTTAHNHAFLHLTTFSYVLFYVLLRFSRFLVGIARYHFVLAGQGDEAKTE